jgi:hypothetical protein
MKPTTKRVWFPIRRVFANLSVNCTYLYGVSHSTAVVLRVHEQCFSYEHVGRFEFLGLKVNGNGNK